MLYSRSRARSRLARRLSWLVVLSLTTVALVAPGAAAPVSAASVAPIFLPADIDGDGKADANPTCEDLDGIYGGGQTWVELEKIDGSPTNGTYGEITITGASGQTFSWSSTVPVDAVLVKAGSDNHALYVYAPTAASAESSGDTNLTHGPSPQGTSHVSFCYDTSNPPPTLPPTEAPTTAPPTEAPTTAPPTVAPTTAPPTVAPTQAPTEAPGDVMASILIAKFDTRGTNNPNDDLMLDGASFEVYRDDGDETFDAGDELVVAEAPTDGGLLDTDLLDAGWYWIVESIVPDGYVGSDPTLVELNTDDKITCIWDAAGLIECEDNVGNVRELSWTIVLVDNAPIGEAPTGAVGSATGRPGGAAGITLPPTDTLSGGTSVPAGDGWRLILLAMAGLIAAALLMTPATAVVRRNDRHR